MKYFRYEIFMIYGNVLSVHTNVKLYPVNPYSFVMIHGNELRPFHLITGAPHCVNPPLIKLLGVCLYSRTSE